MGQALDIASQHDQSAVHARELVNIGHRGASAHAPEHTIAAYDLALAEGAHYLELDVHTTLDGIPIVLHDTSVDRTGRLAHRPGSGVVSSMTLQELRTLDVGSWFAESRGGRSTFDGLHILTLDEVFDRYRHCARFCIDIKSVDTGGATEREVLRLLHRHSLDEPKKRTWRVLLMSFSRDSLQTLRTLHAGIPLVQIFSEGPTRHAVCQELDAVGVYATGIAAPKRVLDRALVRAVHRQGLQVHPYIVNERAEMVRFLSLGVDGIITDFPGRLDRLIRESFFSARLAPPSHVSATAQHTGGPSRATLDA